MYGGGAGSDGNAQPYFYNIFLFVERLNDFTDLMILNLTKR